MKNRLTVGSYFDHEIVLPSKMNDKCLAEISFMWPHSDNIPALPTGMNYRRGIYESLRVVNGTRMYVGASSDFITALKMLETFCEKHNLKP